MGLVDPQTQDVEEVSYWVNGSRMAGTKGAERGQQPGDASSKGMRHVEVHGHGDSGLFSESLARLRRAVGWA